MIKSLAKDTNVYTHCKIGGYSVDIYVPEWKLALEYQGTQHYQPSYKSDLKRYVHLLSNCFADKMVVKEFVMEQRDSSSSITTLHS